MCEVRSDNDFDCGNIWLTPARQCFYDINCDLQAGIGRRSEARPLFGGKPASNGRNLQRDSAVDAKGEEPALEMDQRSPRRHTQQTN